MSNPMDIVVYSFLFFSLYVEVFLFLALFEKKHTLKKEIVTLGEDAPSVTIIVPCFNEQNTIAKTIDSILALRYPKGKLQVMIVDDGSTDNTWNVASAIAKEKGILAFRKENGGKHTALNFALEHVTTECVGCLDADSFVDEYALEHMAPMFGDKTIMAVTPAIKLYEPKNILERVQNVEYNMGIAIKKTLALIGGVYVTPGPFSIFRKKVFDDLGPYRKAHNTEDCEIALRMQKNGYKIENCHTAQVYTVAPKTVRKLIKQRVRWTHGFLENAIDYRDIFFNPRYGSVGMFTLPTAIISIFTSLFIVGWTIEENVAHAIQTYIHYKSINFTFQMPTWDFNWFYIDTKVMTFISLILFAMTLALIIIGTRFAGEKRPKVRDVIFFSIFYGLISPFWLIRSIYNTAVSKQESWR